MLAGLFCKDHLNTIAKLENANKTLRKRCSVYEEKLRHKNERLLTEWSPAQVVIDAWKTYSARKAFLLQSEAATRIAKIYRGKYTRQFVYYPKLKIRIMERLHAVNRLQSNHKRKSNESSSTTLTGLEGNCNLFERHSNKWRKSSRHSFDFSFSSYDSNDIAQDEKKQEVPKEKPFHSDHENEDDDDLHQNDDMSELAGLQDNDDHTGQIDIIDKSVNIVYHFSSISKAARAFGVNKSSIRRLTSGRKQVLLGVLALYKTPFDMNEEKELKFIPGDHLQIREKTSHDTIRTCTDAAIAQA